jgi:hypothetical protein
VGINAAQSLTERPRVGRKIRDGGDEGVEDENSGAETVDEGVNTAQRLAERARVQRRRVRSQDPRWSEHR